MMIFRKFASFMFELQIVPNMRWSRTYLSQTSDASSRIDEGWTTSMFARQFGHMIWSIQYTPRIGSINFLGKVS